VDLLFDAGIRAWAPRPYVKLILVVG
jgi:hypothetical protein